MIKSMFKVILKVINSIVMILLVTLILAPIIYVSELIDVLIKTNRIVDKLFEDGKKKTS